MKCPKCDYLGFDTGERCRNCGYDFSLMATAPVAAAGVTTASELPLRRLDRGPGEPVSLPEEVDRSLGGRSPVRTPRAARAGEPALPLFSPPSADDDAPLIKMPAAPRPPLSVRRTPESAGSARRVPRESAPREAPSSMQPAVLARRTASDAIDEPTLGFADDVAYFPSEQTIDERRAVRTPATIRVAGPLTASGVIRRVIALLIDHAILLGIDTAVIYFTLRLVSLTWSDWQLLSPAPLLAFLILIKLAYFTAFTALGGQTIGKMATHIRVVSEEDRFVDPAHAIRRSLAGVLSLLTFGIGFLPALLTSDRRALHDRLAHTRVVSQ